MDRFQFTYQIEPDEVPLIVHHLQSRSPRIRRLVRIRLLILLMTWVGLTLYVFVKQSDFEQLFLYSAGLLLLFGLVYLLSIWADRWWWINNLKSSPLFMAQKEVGVQPNGITIRTNNSETQLAWSAIQKIDNTPLSFYLFLDNNTAIAVPRRVFSSEVEVEQFLGMIQSHSGMITTDD